MLISRRAIRCEQKKPGNWLPRRYASSQWLLGLIAQQKAKLLADAVPIRTEKPNVNQGSKQDQRPANEPGSLPVLQKQSLADRIDAKIEANDWIRMGILHNNDLRMPHTRGLPKDTGGESIQNATQGFEPVLHCGIDELPAQQDHAKNVSSTTHHEPTTSLRLTSPNVENNPLQPGSVSTMAFARDFESPDGNQHVSVGLSFEKSSQSKQAIDFDSLGSANRLAGPNNDERSKVHHTITILEKQRIAKRVLLAFHQKDTESEMSKLTLSLDVDSDANMDWVEIIIQSLSCIEGKEIHENFKKSLPEGSKFDESIAGFAEPVFGFLEDDLDNSFVHQAWAGGSSGRPGRIWTWIVNRQGDAKARQAAARPDLQQTLWPIEFFTALNFVRLFCADTETINQKALGFFTNKMKYLPHLSYIYQHYLANHKLRDISDLVSSGRFTAAFVCQRFELALTMRDFTTINNVIDTARTMALKSSTSKVPWLTIFYLRRTMQKRTDYDALLEGVKKRCVAMFRNIEGGESQGGEDTLYMCRSLYDIFMSTKDLKVFIAVHSVMRKHVLTNLELERYLSLLLDRLPIAGLSHQVDKLHTGLYRHWHFLQHILLGIVEAEVPHKRFLIKKFIDRTVKCQVKPPDQVVEILHKWRDANDVVKAGVTSRRKDSNGTKITAGTSLPQLIAQANFQNYRL